MEAPLILNVDDNDINRYVRSQHLAAAGFRSLEATTVRQAMECALQKRPDLVLLDVNLPDGDGIDLCRCLKSDARLQGTMVLQISASAIGIADAVRGLEGGADGYLVEPVEGELLIAHVRSLLRLRDSEQALQKSEDRLRLALGAAHMGTYEWDLPSNRVSWGGAHHELFGITPEQFEGTLEAVLALVHPEDRASLLERATSASTGFQHEFRIIRPDGALRWIWTQGNMVSTDGYPERLVGVVLDITERRRTEEALRASEARLQLAIDAAGMGFWERDLATDEVISGGHHDTLLGLAPGTFQGTYAAFLARLHPEDRAAVEAQIADSVATGQPYRAEFRVVSPTAETRWIRMHGNLLRSRPTPNTHMAGVFYDITERKWAEQALEQAIGDLQQFAFAAAHDLQAPIRTVRVFAQLLQSKLRGQPGASVAEYIENILAGTARMQDLVDSLLAYARAAQSPVDVRSNASLEDALAQALTGLQGPLQEAAGMVDVDSLPSIPIWQDQITQVFQNLVANAINYRRPGVPPRIHVSAEREGRTWVVSVRDNGQGFDPKHAEEIFGVLKRLHGGEVPGSGLGLAICRRIIERHGGHIWAESEPGRGSIFRFRLPVALAAAP
ncbi:MAG: PAS domain-containing protein [Bryobacterales bacterium]|nr:PAS domain-containing protein [Bryobacterales bacterium]